MSFNTGAQKASKYVRDLGLLRVRTPRAPQLLPCPVGAGAVQVDQDIARFSALTRAHDSAIFEFIHDARRAAIAKTEAALKKRDAGFLFAADDLDTLLYDFLVFVA